MNLTPFSCNLVTSLLETDANFPDYGHETIVKEVFDTGEFSEKKEYVEGFEEKPKILSNTESKIYFDSNMHYYNESSMQTLENIQIKKDSEQCTRKEKEPLEYIKDEEITLEYGVLEEKCTMKEEIVEGML